MVLLAALGTGEQRGASGVLEHLADTLARLGRALEIVLGADLLCYCHTLQYHTTSNKDRDKGENGILVMSATLKMAGNAPLRG